MLEQLLALGDLSSAPPHCAAVAVRMMRTGGPLLLLRQQFAISFMPLLFLFLCEDTCHGAQPDIHQFAQPPPLIPCADAASKLCGDAKDSGPQRCMGCVGNHATELVADGCTDPALRAFCGEPPPAPPASAPSQMPLPQQTLGHMQLMLGYSTAPEYVRGFANVIMAGVSGYNQTAPDGAVTLVSGSRVDPTTLKTVWGLRSFVSMPNVFAAVRANAHGWRETIASWGRVVRPLADSGIVIGVFVGDESCSNFNCPFSNISAIVDAVRTAVGGGNGKPPWIYDNEQGPWNPSSWGLSRWPEIPRNLDLISFDFYYPNLGGLPNATVAGQSEPHACREKYNQYLYPKLAEHQRVMLVPFTAACDVDVCELHNVSCTMEEQAAVNVARLQAYYEWAINDTRVAGFDPWHVLNSSSVLWPGYCTQRLGAVSMPPVMDELCRIGTAISPGPNPCALMPALPPAPAPGMGGEAGFLVGNSQYSPAGAVPWPPPPQWTPHQAIKYFGHEYVIVEGENLTVSNGWSVRRWGEGNYFSDTTVSFMNRKAYLHLPATARRSSSATAWGVHIADPGDYLVLARYEALERFDTPFRIVVSQNGAIVLDHVYGLTSNLKIWGNERRGTPGCSQGLNRVCQFVCGPEGLVWEGLSTEHPKATLVEGHIDITITGSANRSVPYLGDINLDTLLITRNESDAWLRLNIENGTLPLDGLLSQAGEVYAQFQNTGNVSLNFTVPSSIPKAPCGQSSGDLTNPVPTAVGSWHGLKSGCGWATQGDNGGCIKISMAPGEFSPITYVGHLWNSLNDGSWNVPQQLGQGNLSQPGARFAVHLMSDCRRHGTECGFVGLGGFQSEAGGVSVLIDANTIATKRVRQSGMPLLELVEAMRGLDPQLHQGRFPALMPIYGTTFGANAQKAWRPAAVQGPADWWGWKRTDPDWVNALNEWARYFPLTTGNASQTWGRIIWDIGQSNEGDFSVGSANRSIHQLLAQGIDPHAVLVGTLGDEIHLLRPEQRIPLNESDALFHSWAVKRGLTVSQLGCATWMTCHYLALSPSNPMQNQSKANPRLYYYSNLFAHDWGIAKIKNATDLSRQLLPAARIGANLPCMCESDEWGGYILKNGQVHTNSYLGLTYTYIRSFREEALTLPWSEDWVFGPPVGTQQMTALLIDAFRSAVRFQSRSPLLMARPRTADSSWSGSAPIMMYTMLHSPGNTPTSWRRQLFSDIAHGVKLVNLFGLLDAYTAPGPDYVGLTAGGASHYVEARRALNELGNFDDIVMHGAAQSVGRPVALLFSETGDIFHDSWGTAGAAKRSLYIALKHSQCTVDVVIEEDIEAVEAVLSLYKVLYVVDPHIRASAARALQTWVETGGGTLVSTVNGGMLDEANQSSSLQGLASVFGMVPTNFKASGVVNFIKRDLRFTTVLDNVTINWGSFPATWRRGADPDIMATTYSSMVVVGEQSHMSWQKPAQIVASYSDGSAAASLAFHPGGGCAMYIGWHAGLSYFHPAIPLRPADKGNRDSNFNHFVPTDFDAAARTLLAMPALASSVDVVPVVVSESLVESGVIKADALGIAIVLINWSAQQVVYGLTVTLAFDVPWLQPGFVSLASGRSLVVSRAPHPHASQNASLARVDAYRFTFDMHTSEAIILRQGNVRAVS